MARMMYQWRFPGEDTSELTMQQLRGWKVLGYVLYRQWSERTGVPWERREYDPNNFGDGSPINQALSAAHAALYGIVHAAMCLWGVRLGWLLCIPGILGLLSTTLLICIRRRLRFLLRLRSLLAIREGIDLGLTRRAGVTVFRSEKVMERVVRDI